MCIGIWSLNHPEYALIVCTNRDEYLDRPTLDAHWHNFEPIADSPEHLGQEHTKSSREGKILSGRDIKAGGSWFGINSTGRIALLTNITEPPTKLTSSRGFLVSSFLTSPSSHPLEDELGGIVDPNGKFAGFNLTLFAPHWKATRTSPDPSLSYSTMLVTNHGASGKLTSRPLNPSEVACGAVSNGIDGQGGEEWQKCRIGRSALEAILRKRNEEGKGEGEEVLLQKLFSVLSRRSEQPVTHRTELRNTVLVEPIRISGDGSKGWPEEPNKNNVPAKPTTSSAESSKDKYYGTRLSTVLLVRHNGEVLFVERDIWKVDETGVVKAQGPSSERRVRFRIPVINEETGEGR